MKKIFLSSFCLELIFAITALAQTLPPVMFVESQSGTNEAGPDIVRETLSVKAVRIEALIHGSIAETAMTLTFYNDHYRALAGDLCFPLPEGATVSGYALDIKGQMVDGVVVEKEKARRVFEKEARKGIDPGLVEWTRGNNFRTRVFPIPAKGSRTVTVKYVSDLIRRGGGLTYHMPLNFSKAIDDFSVRIEVVKSPAAPVIKSKGIPGMKFQNWRDSYVAEGKAVNTIPARNLVVCVPEIESRTVYVEKSPDGRYFFCINDRPAVPAQKTKQVFSDVTVLWDASGSRGRVDHKKELDILKAFFVTNRNVRVDLVVFRNAAEPPKPFRIRDGNTDELFKEISSIKYDGGTQLGCVSGRNTGVIPDCYMLFTDGLSNLGTKDPGRFSRPLYVFSADSSADHQFLRYLAEQTGGEYFNLTRLKSGEVLRNMGSVPYMFLRASADDAAVLSICPGTPQAVHGTMTVSGILKADIAKVVLEYGFGGKTSERKTYTVSRADVAERDLLRKYWAQKKLDDMMVFQKQNSKEMTELGKEHGLVTPGTSLMVLETLEQYIEHKVMPPASLPAMRAEYNKKMADAKEEAGSSKDIKINSVIAKWNERVKWWNKEYDLQKILLATNIFLSTNSAADVTASTNSIRDVPYENLGYNSAVVRSLNWLKKEEALDGSWNQSIRDTSLGVLAYLAHGETPSSALYGPTVQKSISYLVSAQSDDGRYDCDLEAQSMAAYALSESYSITGVPIVKIAAEKATSAMIEDLMETNSLSGWQASALRSAKLAALTVPDLYAVISNAVNRLKNEDTPGALYGLQQLGQGQCEKARSIQQSIEDFEYDWSRYTMDELRNVTMAKFTQGGEQWRKWNQQFSSKLVRQQKFLEDQGPNGEIYGFWLSSNQNDRAQGKVYCTAMAASMLQVYYRYLPTYRGDAEPSAGEPDSVYFDEVVTDQSPVVMHGIIGSRHAGQRGSLLGCYGGGGSARPAAGATPEIAEVSAPEILIKPWDPATPYLKNIKDAPGKDYFAAYLEQKKEYGSSPAFYLDCADFFMSEKQNELALQVLSNVAELELDDPSLLRVLGHRLAQLNMLDLSRIAFEEVLALRPEEPQSFRDLAIVLEKQGNYAKAAELLYKVVINTWDRFDEIELIALTELNRLIPKLKEEELKKLDIDQRLIKLLDVDIRIVMTWQADMTDMDLWVTEPSRQKAFEKAFYSNPNTRIGGHVSKDFTQGYGPEEYMIRKAMKGKYKIEANYFGSSAVKLTGAVILNIDIFTNYGRPDEQHRSITLQLKDNKETVLVGEVEF